MSAVSEPPKPRAGQVWSAPSRQHGRSYVRIEAVRLKKTEDAYVNTVRVTDATGTRLKRPSTSSPFAGLVVRHRLVRGEMGSPFVYEGEAGADREASQMPEGESPDPEALAPTVTPAAPPPPNETKEERRKRQKREAAIRFREKHRKEKS